MVDKIGYTRPTTATTRASATRKTGNVAGAQFAEALAKAEGVGDVSGVDSVQSVAAVGGAIGLLGAQEVSEDDIKKRRAVKKGRLTLDALSNLRDALLMGSLPLSTLKQLEKIVAEERGTTNDPLLNSILDDIEVRAAVELAKLEMSGIKLS
jgi:hypothetical protein